MNLVSKDVSQQLIAGETVQMIIMKENLDINNLTDITIGIQFHTPLDLYIAISSNPVMNTLKKIWYSNKIHFLFLFIFNFISFRVKVLHPQQLKDRKRWNIQSKS